uniref:F-box domain-containing protein n=1 Tax=Tanacetum cinerariifolium TaxID=118510 RepID=A0A6L2KYY5_TANCI|nr:hypothetical protein [Tanacetum cinerariifolium]
MGVEDEQESKRMRMINCLSMIHSHTLPPEIIVEILLRCPVESLLRCKSVCKSWYKLISSRYFIKSHVKLWNEKNRYVSPKLVFNVPIYRFRRGYTRTNVAALYMISTCNGLLCYVKDWNTHLIYNPSTRVSNTLPSSGYAGARYAFGYDESTHDYKVIALSSRVNKAKIYSVKTGVWKNINDIPHIPAWCKRATFSNKAFHWMVRKKVGSSFRLTTIVSLGLATETFSEVPPPVYDNECNRLMLNKQPQQLEKYLHASSVSDKGPKSNFASHTTSGAFQYETPTFASKADPTRLDDQFYMHTTTDGPNRWNSPSVSYDSTS